MRIGFFIGCILMLLQNGFGQQKDYYVSPLSIPLSVSGNFGELRPNHFHMGLDFRTGGREGAPIYSVQEGSVSRIKVSPYGYGKVIYIDHPNGKTSVYGHCSSFVGKIDSIVKSEQYKQKKFVVELFLKKGDLPVTQGQLIAYSGNTGGSSGPHLHFELRDSKSESALNPLKIANFKIDDNRPPEILKLKVFAVNEQGYVNPSFSVVEPVIKSQNRFTVKGDTLKLSSNFSSDFGGVGLAFDVFDKVSGSESKVGLYKSYLIVDGDTIFGHQIDSMSFEHTRYINTHRDISISGDMAKSFKNCSNPLFIYTHNGLGVISVEPESQKKVTFVAQDENGNSSTLSFVIAVLPGNKPTAFQPSMDAYWYPEQTFEVKQEKWQLVADSFSIYEPTLMNQQFGHLCNVGIPLQKGIEVKMKLEQPQLSVEKYYLSIATKNGHKELATRYQDGWLVANSNYSGVVSIRSDIAPPIIRPITTSLTITTKRVVFQVTDSQTTITSYDLFIDDHWHLMEYESKNNTVYFDVPVEIKGQHQVRLVIQDACKNSATWEKMMIFN